MFEKMSYADLLMRNQHSKKVSGPFIEKKEDFIKRNSMTIIPIQISEFDGLLKDDNSLKYHSDIWLVTNEKRLQSLSIDSIRQLQSALEQKNIPSPFEGFSDEQIFASIKSRNIQSPSELKGFFEQMDESFKALTAELDLFKSEQEKSEKEAADGAAAAAAAAAASAAASSDNKSE